ncbi:MAG TPA: hypothetical protein VGE02_01730 [Gemmatimonadales bacterium]
MTRTNVRRALLMALSLGTAFLAACADATAPQSDCDSGTYGGSGTRACSEYSGTYGGSGT